MAAAVPLIGEALPRPAAASTAVGSLAPAVVILADEPEIAVDASAGNDFRIALHASRMMGSPVNASDGQQIVFQVTQGPAGSCVLIWETSYQFPARSGPPRLSTAPGQTDLLGFVYHASSRTWLLSAYVGGFG